VQQIVEKVHAGNIYVNRDQIGAIVGSQPFGGEGLSGTGPKAGGPHYLPRFADRPAPVTKATWPEAADMKTLKKRIAVAKAPAPAKPTDLPGPTGESNRHSTSARGPILCMGPGADVAQEQLAAVKALGGIGISTEGSLTASQLSEIADLGAVIWWGDTQTGRALETALSTREGPIIALITGMPDAAHVLHERHVCIDTTAAGGNAALLAEVAEVAAPAFT
jgi:RHH-type proline utilization regulon transcriptional repressor/proline dehydrogenase/delta 1-pyrroline-5-carboxylate dehydrogenase